MKVLIADDEHLARQRLRRMLRTNPSVEIVAECANGRETIEAIRTYDPDLVLLDVQMPEFNGFEVLNQLGNQKAPFVVFVTAFDRYAIQAFDVYAVDYLLKPFNKERVDRAIHRVKAQLQQDQSTRLDLKISNLLQELRNRTPYMERILIKEEERSWLLNVQDIYWIQADHKGSRIHIAQKSYMVSDALSRIEDKLDPGQFLRIHRSTIINVNRIKEIQNPFYGDQRIVLTDGTSSVTTSPPSGAFARSSLCSEL